MAYHADRINKLRVWLTEEQPDISEIFKDGKSLQIKGQSGLYTIVDGRYYTTEQWKIIEDKWNELLKEEGL